MKSASQNPSLLRALDWNEICPWLLLMKCLRLGVSFRLLALMMIHVWIGLFLWGGVFLKEAPPEGTFREMLGRFSVVHQPLFGKVKQDVSTMEPNQLIANLMAEKIELQRQSFPPHPLWLKILVGGYLFLSSALLYMMIGRITAVKVATGIRPYTHQCLGLAMQRFSSMLAAVFFLMLGMGICLLPTWLGSFLPGWMMGLTTPFILLLDLLAVFVVVGGMLGFPLVLSTLTTENTDCFDGLSRAYAYTFQRPLRYLFYVTVACFWGVLGYAAMRILVFLTIGLWGTCLGREVPMEAQAWVEFWGLSLGLLPLAFLLTYGCSAWTGIYMLLRRDVDAVELDEVWLENSQGVPTPQLPKLKQG